VGTTITWRVPQGTIELGSSDHLAWKPANWADSGGNEVEFSLKNALHPDTIHPGFGFIGFERNDVDLDWVDWPIVNQPGARGDSRDSSMFNTITICTSEVRTPSGQNLDEAAAVPASQDLGAEPVILPLGQPQTASAGLNVALLETAPDLGQLTGIASTSAPTIDALSIPSCSTLTVVK
jgi:hypothetical protein